MEANIRLDHELLAVEGEHTVHAMLELSAPAGPTNKPRPPLRLALVIDRSGSMGGPKLEVAKQCASYLVHRLAPTDHLALVTYDDEVELVSPLVPVNQALLSAIAAVFAGGSTNLSGGWLKGLEELKRPGEPGPRKILLLTDGLANVGVTDPGSLVTLARNASAAGVGTTTIGFGDGFDEDLLTAMADAGGGNGHYAATPDEAPSIFAQEFEGLVKLVAQNLSVEIRPSQDVKMLGVLNEYPEVAMPGGVQIQMGDVYGEERRRAVFELHIPEVAKLGVQTVAEVVVRYVSVGEDIAAHELTLPITVNMVSTDEAKAAKPNKEVVEEVVVLKAALAQEEARKLADAGDFRSARQRLMTSAQELRVMAPESARPEELLDHAMRLEDDRSILADEQAFSSEMSKTMRYESWSVRRGRPRPRKRPGPPASA
jgi:Ca-activated chloride channel family protein